MKYEVLLYVNPMNMVELGYPLCPYTEVICFNFYVIPLGIGLGVQKESAPIDKNYMWVG